MWYTLVTITGNHTSDSPPSESSPAKPSSGRDSNVFIDVGQASVWLNDGSKVEVSHGTGR